MSSYEINDQLNERKLINEKKKQKRKGRKNLNYWYYSKLHEVLKFK